MLSIPRQSSCPHLTAACLIEAILGVVYKTSLRTIHRRQKKLNPTEPTEHHRRSPSVSPAPAHRPRHAEPAYNLKVSRVKKASRSE